MGCFVRGVKKWHGMYNSDVSGMKWCDLNSDISAMVGKTRTLVNECVMVVSKPMFQPMFSQSTSCRRFHQLLAAEEMAT